MKDFNIMILFVCLFMLVACSEDVPEKSPVDTGEQAGELEEGEPAPDLSEEEEPVLETESEEDPAPVEKAETDSPLDLQQILLKSAEAMTQLDGMKVEAKVVSTQSNRYQDSVITWDMEREYNWTAGEIIHEFISVSDSRGEEPMRLELYHTGQGMQYVQNLDHNQGEWTLQDSFVGGYQHFYERGEMDLLLYADYPWEFSLTEAEDSYTVSFDGSDEGFENLIFGIYYYLDEGFFNEERSSTEDDYYGITGIFNMTIDKETFLIREWEMEYEGGRQTEALGDYYNIEKATYKNSDFNQYDALEIPTEVVNSANEG